jgi:hypothetical protein
LDLVAVFTGGNYNSDLSAQPVEMLIKHIIPAVLPPAPAILAAKISSHEFKKYAGQYYFQTKRICIPGNCGYLFAFKQQR